MGSTTEYLYGGVEAGGTKIICCVGTSDGHIKDRMTIPTASPEENFASMFAWFHRFDLKAFALAWFGPILLDKEVVDYGRIGNTPKPGWKDVNVRRAFWQEFHLPVTVTTDVNASLVGEVSYGAAKGLTDVLYLTVGTGVGAGILSGGRVLQGVSHPEAGHMLLNRQRHDARPCTCPYHEACLEGLVSGSAIEKRFGASAKEIPEASEAWDLEVDYLATALYNYMLILSPQRIILGGGVMGRAFLFDRLRERLEARNGEYMELSDYGSMEKYLVPASLHGDQALMGCLRLASTCF